MVSKYHANNDTSQVSSIVTTSACVVTCIGMVFTCMTLFFKTYAIQTIIPTSSQSYVYAKEYLEIRFLSFTLALLNSLAFATMRGQKDVMTPMKINMYSQIANMILNPIFMMKMGIKGIALGTVISESLSCICFYKTLIRRKILHYKNFNIKLVKNMCVNGLSIQMRSVSKSIIHLLGCRRAQYIDLTGAIALSSCIELSIV